MSTYAEIQAQIERLQKEAEDLRIKELTDVIKDIKAKIDKFGLSAKDLGLTSGAKRGRKPSGTKAAGAASVHPAKYRGPDGETWSGFGRQPQWLHEALAQGKKKEDFAI